MGKKIATGIIQRGDQLEWTSMRFSKSGAGSKDRSGDAKLEDPESIDMSELIKKHASSFKGKLHVGLPAERVLMHITDLPTTESEEIEGMVDLQLDEVSPFPLEQLYSSFEVLKQEEGSSKVMILAAQQQEVDGLEEMYQSAGLSVHRIDVDVLAWWHLIKVYIPTRFEQRRFLLIFDRHNTFFIAVEKGMPVLFRSLGLPCEGEYMDDFMKEISEEVEYTQTSLESGWEDENVTLDIWHWGAVPGGLDVLQKKTGLTTELFNLPDLPSLSEGIVQRASIRVGEVVNLVPQSWKDAEERKKAKQQFIYSAVAMVVIWLLCIITFLTLLNFREKKMRAMELEIASLEKPAEDVRFIKSKIQSLSKFTNQTYSVLECLRETIVPLPKNTLLANWRYTKSKEISVHAKGANNLLHQYNQQLENSPFFSEYKSTIGELSRGQGFEIKISAKLPEEEL